MLAMLVMLHLAANTAVGQETTGPLEWGTSVRLRYESKQDFNFDDSSQDYLLTRTRLHLRYTTDNGGEGFVELQDARVFGESLLGIPPVNGGATPNIYEDHLDIHQAYWNWSFDNASLRVGRQKFTLGDKRLVASLEWVNTARVHDGIRLTVGSAETRQVDFFLSKLVAVDPHDFNDQSRTGSRYMDSSFHGIFAQDGATLTEGQLSYWYFYRENSQYDDKVSTVGLRFTNDKLWWQPDLQAAYQFGKFDGDDHSAWMLHAGVRHNLEKNASFSLAYNFGSGDSDPSDDKHGTFDNLYPLNHPYYGHMDLFSLQNIHNLELSYTKNFGKGMQINAIWNAFWLAEEDTDAWYNAGSVPIRIATTDVDPYVGNELDINVRAPLFSGRLNLLAGVSTFLAGSYLEDFNLTNDAFFYYISATYTIH
ncbi:MAG: alginate export family protein [Proteobacteria bacterium]|nr:alginate export family protein [Pseudomonadota bacterium]